jgi:hypothetical protein
MLFMHLSCMTDGKPQREQPWSIRGVSNETKAAAGIAARRAGITLGAWLDRAVRDAVAEQLSTKTGQEVGPTAAEIMEQVAKMIAGVNQRLDQIEAKPVPQPEERRGFWPFGGSRRHTAGKPYGGK